MPTMHVHAEMAVMIVEIQRDLMIIADLQTALLVHQEIAGQMVVVTQEVLIAGQEVLHHLTQTGAAQAVVQAVAAAAQVVVALVEVAVVVVVAADQDSISLFKQLVQKVC